MATIGIINRAVLARCVGLDYVQHGGAPPRVTTRFERGMGSERAPYSGQDLAEKNRQPGEDEAQVVANGGEDGMFGP